MLVPSKRWMRLIACVRAADCQWTPTLYRETQGCPSTTRVQRWRRGTRCSSSVLCCSTRDLARRDGLRRACRLDRVTIGNQLTLRLDDVVVVTVQLGEATLNEEPATAHRAACRGSRLHPSQCHVVGRSMPQSGQMSSSAFGSTLVRRTFVMRSNNPVAIVRPPVWRPHLERSSLPEPMCGAGSN